MASTSVTYHISGLQTHVYGVHELQQRKPKHIDVVFLLHGRTGSYKDFEPFAVALLDDDKAAQSSKFQRGLIVVLFDHRNHGHRIVSQLGNLGWAEGNPLHAQDMFSIQYGTSQDVSLLITFLPYFLPAELFPPEQGEPNFANIICAGISLGGHSTYHVLSDDERVEAGVVIIGCPSLNILMLQRAGSAGESRDTLMPPAFVQLMTKLSPRLDSVGKKDLLILKGDEDQLVPWSASEEFVNALPRDRTEVVGYPGVGHAFPDVMMHKSVEWITDWRRKH